MSRTRRLAAVLLLTSSLPTSALAASNAADSAYWDYRIPAHHWHQWIATLSGFANHSDISSSDDRQGRQGSLQGQVRTSATGGHDSDPLFQSWGLDVTLSGERSHSQDHQSVSGQTEQLDQENASSFLSERIIAAYSVRAYPWAFPMGFTASTQQIFGLGQSFNSAEVQSATPGFRQVALGSAETDAWSWNGALAVGAGLGRVRDVTPVYEAQVLEDRLVGSGALVRPLSRSARERLAALFTVQGEVRFAHDRPDKYFWEELERVLIEDGALERGSLTLFDAHRILEPTSIRGRIFRSSGWFFGPSVSLSAAQTNSSVQSRSSTRAYQADTLLSASESGFDRDNYRRRDFVSTALTVEYHRPAGPNWQYDLRQDTSSQESGEFLRSGASASATWVVADRWLATASINHDLLWGGSGLERSPESWAIQYGADLSYFLEDSWALTLSGSEYQGHNSIGHGRSGSYYLGIGYVFSGLFEAPGITAAMRPIPGGR